MKYGTGFLLKSLHNKRKFHENYCKKSITFICNIQFFFCQIWMKFCVRVLNTLLLIICDFRENRPKEGRTFLVDISAIAFVRLPSHFMAF
jgi:hypothetical protein